MRKGMICIFLAVLLSMPVGAVELTAPEVPSSGAAYMPRQTQDFSDALLEILSDAVGWFRPDLKEAVNSCLVVLTAVMLMAVVSVIPSTRKGIVELVCAVVIGTILLRSSQSLIRLGADTVHQLSEYGKLLLPVMTAALAAQGALTSAASLYTGTAVFDAILSAFLSKVLVPAIYFFLALAVGSSALADPMLKKIRDGIKGTAVWCLKTVLYVYTGYIAVTGVVSGTTDASVLKAAKLTISGMVPIVGGILSDASEAVLVSAGTVKNAAGIYGMLAILAVWIGPFLRIGAHYLVLKGLVIVCSVFEVKSASELIADFSAALGLLLAMTGAVCLMLMISTVCFMKGVAG